MEKKDSRRSCLRLCVTNGDCWFPGDNLDKQLVRYQRRRKGQVVQPFQGDVTDHIHSQEAASMSPPADTGRSGLCFKLRCLATFMVGKLFVFFWAKVSNQIVVIC